MRKDDKFQHSYQRSERIFQKMSSWYFTVRQGAVFGPYETKQNAEKSLKSFISILQEQ